MDMERNLLVGRHGIEPLELSRNRGLSTSHYCNYFPVKWDGEALRANAVPVKQLNLRYGKSIDISFYNISKRQRIALFPG
jgi:hypothetical protein